MNVTAVGGNNAEFNARSATFARSTLVELIGRPHLNVFNQERFIPPNIDLHSVTKLLCVQSAASAANA